MIKTRTIKGKTQTQKGSVDFLVIDSVITF